MAPINTPALCDERASQWNKKATAGGGYFIYIPHCWFKPCDKVKRRKFHTLFAQNEATEHVGEVVLVLHHPVIAHQTGNIYAQGAEYQRVLLTGYRVWSKEFLFYVLLWCALCLSLTRAWIMTSFFVTAGSEAAFHWGHQSKHWWCPCHGPATNHVRPSGEDFVCFIVWLHMTSDVLTWHTRKFDGWKKKNLRQKKPHNLLRRRQILGWHSVERILLPKHGLVVFV